MNTDVIRKYKEAGLKGLASLVDEVLMKKELFLCGGNIKFTVTEARIEGKSLIYRCCGEGMLKIKGIAESDENKYRDKDKIQTDPLFYCQKCGRYRLGSGFSSYF